MLRVKTELRRFSFILWPSLGFFIALLLFCDTFNAIDESKMSVVVGIAGSLIGILLTVFTIYIAFPKESKTIQRLVKSGHDGILRRTIVSGVITYTCCVFAWLFEAQNGIVVSLFLSGFSCIFVSLYYISKINKFLQRHSDSG